MALLGSPGTRSHFPDLLERGVRMVFADEFEIADSGVLEQIYTVKGSEKKSEKDVVTAGTGQLLPKTEGATPTYDNIQQAWTKTYTHTTWSLGLEFTEEAMEDNLYMSLASVAGRELAMASAYTRQVQAFDIFNDLTSTVYTAEGTNYALLSTTHFRVDGGTWSNRPTTATLLSIEALEAALQAWTTGMVDQRGRKYLIRPKILMVGAQDEFLAKRLVMTSQGRPQGSDNDINAIRDRDLTVMVNPHLTEDGRWFLIAPKGRQALTQFDRVKAGVRRDTHFDSGNLKFICRQRMSHGTSHVTGIYGSPAS